jgi:hypothetical protein
VLLDELLNFYSLVSIDVAIYAAALAGYFRMRQVAFRPPNPERAFSLLEKSLQKAFPELPEGFTWREAMKKVEAANVDVDLTEVSKALIQYEAWRYGESMKPEEVNREVVRLAKRLSQRGGRWQKP